MAQDITLLWGSGSPPCWRVQIALEEKNLQGYNQKLLSFEKMEHKSQDVLDINARGQLPSFKHGDVIVNESYAACFYLESQFKSEGNKLIPESPAEQALMYQRMFEGLTFYEKLRPFFSLADVTVFPTVATLFRFGLSAERYPNLGEYYALLKERPSIKASWPPHWLENPKGQDTLKDI
ncbi:hypothetical protein FQN60_007763 [Etheostoma spectabile]|uniref:GST N-terminal domain-containing protein n=1 Tax=Etheostoma spectabile TaxID=54343 RepID=A0A5J5CYG4_9PERO|nr:hypothetical protein FQN60_007763 [Etheostoma spectabile]